MARRRSRRPKTPLSTSAQPSERSQRHTRNDPDRPARHRPAVLCRVDHGGRGREKPGAVVGFRARPARALPRAGALTDCQRAGAGISRHRRRPAWTGAEIVLFDLDGTLLDHDGADAWELGLRRATPIGVFADLALSDVQLLALRDRWNSPTPPAARFPCPCRRAACRRRSTPWPRPIEAAAALQSPGCLRAPGASSMCARTSGRWTRMVPAPQLSAP